MVFAFVYLLSVWMESDLDGFGFELVMLVVGASRVRHLHVALAHRVRSVLVSGCGYFGGSRARRVSHHRIPMVVVGMMVLRYGVG